MRKQPESIPIAEGTQTPLFLIRAFTKDIHVSGQMSTAP